MERRASASDRAERERLRQLRRLRWLAEAKKFGLGAKGATPIIVTFSK